MLINFIVGQIDAGWFLAIEDANSKIQRSLQFIPQMT